MVYCLQNIFAHKYWNIKKGAHGNYLSRLGHLACVRATLWMTAHYLQQPSPTDAMISMQLSCLVYETFKTES